MERIFKDSRTIQRYRSSPLGPYIERLAERLCQQGYAREQAQRHLLAVEDFGRRWPTPGGISVSATVGKDTVRRWR
jgi:hypothetical protein